MAIKRLERAVERAERTDAPVGGAEGGRMRRKPPATARNRL
jgi:hypothetical protein